MNRQHIQKPFLDDEDDWLQVSDEDSIGDESSADSFRPPSLALNQSNLRCGESYSLTESGSILLRGFGQLIKANGIVQKEAKCRVAMEDRLIMMQELGRGSCGVVYKAFDVIDKHVVAVKIISLGEKMKRTQLVQELNALQKNAQAERYLLTCIDAFTFSKTSAVGIVVPYMDGGSLQDIIDNGGVQDETMLSIIARQCLLGIQALHKRNHIHRDLKPSNILLSSGSKGIMIADFGLTRFLSTVDKSFRSGQRQESEFGGYASTFVGTLTYMSPERILGEGYNQTSDIFSFGKIMVATALGESPPNSSYWTRLSGVLDKNQEEKVNFSQDCLNWSKDFLDFVMLCLRSDSNSRPSSGALLQHQFLQTHGKNSPDNFTLLIKPTEPIIESKKIMAVLNEKLLQYQNEGNSSVEIQIYIRQCLSLLGLSFEK